ncbi:MAG: hypothetical protein WC121_04995 [Candidatus Kapaibacterium sp.]
MGNISAKESIDIISESILNAKENLKSQSFFYLFWGWLTIVSSLADYALLKSGELKWHFLPWIIIMPIGGIITSVVSKKKDKEKGFRTHLEVFLKSMWIVIAFSMLVVVYISVYIGINPVVLTLLIAGMGTLVSGLTMKFKPLVFGGVVFFVISLTTLYINNENAYLLYALAIAIGYLIPAYKLKNEK